MSRFVNWLLDRSPVCAVALLLCFALPVIAVAADKDGAPDASAPKDGGGNGGNDQGNADEAPPPDAKAEEAPPAQGGGVQSAVKMKDILAEGFLIRTTVLVPADAVTRQIGKVSSDAVLLTLQKETAIAVCYYTLKAYVKESLTDIASCTVFR
jgi:hypothetical protein